MASTTTKPISNIAMAFAAQSASVDIPTPRDDGHGHGSFDGAAGIGHTKHNRVDMLPTPPNSLSPTLPPHKLRPGHHNPSASASLPPPIHVDSLDIDLQDAVDHAKAQDQPTTTTTTALSSAALSNLDTAAAITAALLATNHLPDILLHHGPMAIRHLLSYLAQSVPGFARIPPPKARRLVVTALESRTGGGTRGEVEFEKVGWGRWDARIQGQQQPGRQAPVLGSLQEEESDRLGVSPPASVPGSYTFSSGRALQIPRPRGQGRARRDVFGGGSWGGESRTQSHVSSYGAEEADESSAAGMHMAEHEADKMSLDGCDVEERDWETRQQHRRRDEEEDASDVTDEEDWAAIGAAALRQGVIRETGERKNYNLLSQSMRGAWGGYNGHGSGWGYGHSRSGGANPRSLPTTHRSASYQHQRPQNRRTSSGSSAVVGGVASMRLRTQSPRFGSLGKMMGREEHHRTGAKPIKTEMMDLGPQDSQEREAVEALMRMGSM